MLNGGPLTVIVVVGCWSRAFSQSVSARRTCSEAGIPSRFLIFISSRKSFRSTEILKVCSRRVAMSNSLYPLSSPRALSLSFQKLCWRLTLSLTRFASAIILPA